MMSALPSGASGGGEGDDRAVDDGAAGGERGALRGPVEPDDGPVVGEALDGAEVRLQRALGDPELPDSNARPGRTDRARLWCRLRGHRSV